MGLKKELHPNTKIEKRENKMWFWLLSSIAGSIIGSATESWFRDTKLGIWFYNKVDQLYTWASERYGIKILTDEESFLN